MKSWIRISFYPAILGSALGVFFLEKNRFADGKLPVLVSLISLVAIAVIHATERLLPYRREWNRPRGDRMTNLILTNIVLPVLSKGAELSLGFFAWALIGDHTRAEMKTIWPSGAPLLAQLILALLICEFFFYWAHRLGHRVALLWRFHSIHHVVERVYWNNSGRFHPLDLFLNWFLYFMPLIVFGVSPELMALFLLTNAVTGLLEHANIDFEMGFLNRVFNTAQLHRWHHSVVVSESSTNFGKVLSVWDQIFGTYFLPKERDVGPVGVEGESIPTNVWAQMLYPFRTKTTAVLAAVLVLCISHVASAEDSDRADHFSHCMARPGQKNLILSWNSSELFERKIKMTTTSLPCSAFLPIDLPKMIFAQTVPDSLEGLGLTERQQSLIRQIRFGAAVPRDQENAVDFLKAHPIHDYDFATNHELTDKYGVGFSGEVYRAWIESQPKNGIAKQVFIKSLKSGGKIERNDLVALVSMGLGWESDTSKFTDKTAFWVKDFAREISATGMPTIILQRKAMGQVRENVDLLKPQIREVLASGRDVILSGLCKGVPEMLLAWAEVETEARPRPAQWGHVRAILNMSGMNTGIFFADTMENTLVGQIVKAAAPYLPLSGDLAAEDKNAYPRALESMTTALSDRYRAEYLANISKDIPILNVVGVIEGNGLMKDDRLTMNSFLKLNKKYHLLHAANDGFIEYPGDEIPTAEYPLAATLAFQASHMLTDGSAYGYDMKDSKVREDVYTSMYRYLLLQIDSTVDVTN